MLPQGQRATGLTGLAGCVQQDIRLPLDQRQDLVEIPAPQRRQTVVQIGPDRASVLKKRMR